MADGKTEKLSSAERAQLCAGLELLMKKYDRAANGSVGPVADANASERDAVYKLIQRVKNLSLEL